MKYWNKEGKYQDLYDGLYRTYVPDEGEASTEQGEILRVLSNIYYDVYNNGGCNLKDSKLEDRGRFTGYLFKHGFGLQRAMLLDGLLSAMANYEPTEQGRAQIDELLDEAADLLILKTAELAGIPSTARGREVGREGAR